MIKGDKTECGKLISNLKNTSAKKILRVCDKCGEEKFLAYGDVMSGRLSRKNDKDYCKSCAATGENSFSKTEEFKKIIQEKKRWQIFNI